MKAIGRIHRLGHTLRASCNRSASSRGDHARLPDVVDHHWFMTVRRLLEAHKVRTRKGPDHGRCRTFVITGLHLAGYANIAAARRHQARDTSRPLTTYKIA